MSADGYIGVISRCEEKTEIKKSVFIASAMPVLSEEDALGKIAEIRAEQRGATHNCYAFIADRTGNLKRFSDDGEPQGTAGMPILDVLVKRGLKMTLVVVTRYFGGIKLGAGGLVSAYSGCAARALDKAEKKLFRKAVNGYIDCAYPMAPRMVPVIEAAGAVLSQEYSEKVRLHFAVPEENAEAFEKKICEASFGEIAPVYTGTDFFGFETK